MKSSNERGLLRALLGCVAIALFCCFALALPGRAAEPADPARLWQEECGSCHIAYPPQLLTAESWQVLMAGLGKHFGADATLEPAQAKLVAQYLVANSGAPTRRTAPNGEPRITRQPWFDHEHHEVPASVWQRPAVRSRANCSACHPRAEQADFNEHGIRIPK
jgi:mono/diheme cytochrome c family protein